jgi:outer membrane biosynthesis protein TonB
MTKRQLIQEIMLLNPTARPDFLARFGDRDLEEYLRHLRWVLPAAPADDRRREERTPAPTADLAAPVEDAEPAEPVLLPGGRESQAPESQTPDSASAPEAAPTRPADEPVAVGVAADDQQPSPSSFAEDQEAEQPQSWLY